MDGSELAGWCVAVAAVIALAGLLRHRASLLIGTLATAIAIGGFLLAAHTVRYPSEPPRSFGDVAWPMLTGWVLATSMPGTWRWLRETVIRRAGRRRAA